MTNHPHPDSQQQFLDVLDRDLAHERYNAALSLFPIGEEGVALTEALGRVLARDVVAHVDVPSFDRSNLDGFAVVAADTYGASEETPKRIQLGSERITAGIVPRNSVTTGLAMSIATGGMVPRGADAVVMVEHVDIVGDELIVKHAVVPGHGVSFAGSDIASGEVVLRQGQRLTSRETGVLAAIGMATIPVFRRPRVAILSTGNEIVAPGAPMQPSLVFDSNAQILADSVRELGAIPIAHPIVPDCETQLTASLQEVLDQSDVVLLSGGTSKGAGDVSYRVVSQCLDPGIIVHGVALKPGKPICLASHHGKPVIILPGFPTSAIFTFHEFVAPILRTLAGALPEADTTVLARMATKVKSAVGRQEFVLVGLVRNQRSNELIAYPMGKGSGSVTTFSRADGFTSIPRQQERLDANQWVDVQLLGRNLALAELVVMGSHCVRLDRLLSQIQARGISTKFIAVGSLAGLAAAERGECDIAGVHLLDPVTGIYNRPFLSESLTLVPGYPRRQGIVFRIDDHRFGYRDAAIALQHLRTRTDLRMVNRNSGSGTRVLTDQYLAGSEPPGYAVQVHSHQAVAAAIRQHRADWGIAIDWVIDPAVLGFLPLQDEQFDFAVPRDRLHKPGVQALCELIQLFR